MPKENVTVQNFKRIQWGDGRRNAENHMIHCPGCFIITVTRVSAHFWRTWSRFFGQNYAPSERANNFHTGHWHLRCLVGSYRVSVTEEILIQVRPEPAILQIWIRDYVTKLLLEAMFEIVQTRQLGIVTRAPLEVSWVNFKSRAQMV